MEEYKSFYSLNPENGWNDKDVKLALRFLDDTSLIHNQKETEWRLIQNLFKQTFYVSNPTGTKKITSKLLYQCLSKIIAKQKFLDFQIRGYNTREDVEKTVTDGVGTVLDNGRFAQCFRNKNGVFWKSDLFGDAFIQMGTVLNDSNSLIQYRVCSLSDSYVDNNANGIRDVTSGNSSTEFLNIYRYSEDSFFANYPGLKGKVGCGEIPRTLAEWKQIEKTTNQQLQKQNTNIEVAHYYNLTHKIYLIFAGARCTPIYQFKGGNYPFIKKNKIPFLPIYHFFFEPSSEGFYNHGIGHILYDLAIVLGRMDNMAINHAEDNIYPINFLSVPMDQGAAIMQQISMAQKQRGLGLKPYAIHEFNPNNPNSQLRLDPLQSQPITGEWERLFTRLERIITRMGFQLDAVDRGTNLTATQILAEEENADSYVKQVAENNASESQEIIEDTMELMKSTIDETDDTPINSTVTVQIPNTNQKTNLKDITLGDIVTELKSKNYFVKINARSGSIPSNLMQQAQIAKAIAITPPGTPAYYKLAVKAMKLNNQDITEEELGMPQANQPQPQQQGAEQLEQGGTETDEMKATMSTAKDFMQTPV